MCIINVFSLPRNRKKNKEKLLKAFEDFRGLYSAFAIFKHYNYITEIKNVGVSSILIIMWLEPIYTSDPAVLPITYHDTCTTVQSIPSLHWNALKCGRCKIFSRTSFYFPPWSWFAWVFEELLHPFSSTWQVYSLLSVN